MKKPHNILTVLLLLCSPTLFAQQHFSTQSVSIFKNGTAFFIKSGQVKPEAGTYAINPEAMPNALFGTLWVHSPSMQLKHIRSVDDSVKRTTNVEDIGRMLQANKGKQIRLETNKDEVLSGAIHSVTENASLLVLKMESEWRSLPVSRITSLSFAKEPATEREYWLKQRQLQIDFLSKAPTQELTMMYLQRGLGWFPNYLIELTGEDKARLTLRAEVVNDAEPLENASVNFVVGVPNFSYTGSPSPIVSNTRLFDFVQMVERQENRGYLNNRGDFLSNSIMTQSISYGVGQDEDLSTININGSLDGSAEEDLYFYQLKNVTLPANGRAFYTILNTEIPVTHIYETHLPPNNEGQNYYPQSEARDKNTEVVHLLKINNPTQQPFTTGTGLVVKSQEGVAKPISQDQLKYTPVGGHSFLKITTAPDIAVTHKEEESSRAENDKRVNKTNYDLVTVAGEITIKNYKSQPVNLNVKRVVTGALQTSKPDWLTAVRVNLSAGVNPITDVCWELKLKAKEEKKVKYNYQIWIRN